MIRLNERDQKILEGIKGFEVLSTSQIREHFFNGIALSTVLRRLRKLEMDRFIFRQPVRMRAQELWSIDRMGAPRVELKAPYPRLNRPSLFRAYSLSQLRDVFETRKIGENWSSARELRTIGMGAKGKGPRAASLPDAVFTFQNGGIPKTAFLKLVLETTAFPKNQKVLTSFAKMDTLACILLVVESESLIPLLFAQWEGTYKPGRAPTLIISVLGQLIDLGWKAKVFLSARESLSLSGIVDPKGVENRSSPQSAETVEDKVCP